MKKIFWLLSILILLVKKSEGQEVSGIYTLPIFEVSQTKKTIIGLREENASNEIQCSLNRKHGVYLNNPYLVEKLITKINLGFIKLNRKIETIQIEIYPAKEDSFPSNISVFDTTISLVERKQINIELKQRIALPQNGVIVAYTLKGKDNTKLNPQKVGQIKAKRYSERHRIRFDWYKSVWRRYPFEEWINNPDYGDFIKKQEKLVPAINLTLVNSK